MPFTHAPSPRAHLRPATAFPVDTVRLWGLRLASITEARCVSLVIQQLAQNKGGWLVTPNLEILRQTTRHRDRRRLVRRATLAVPDGITLLWASQLRKQPLQERVCGSNLIYSLTAAAAEHNCSVFFLGGDHDTAQRTADAFATHHPTLKIAGAVSPPPGFEKDPAQMARLVDHLKHAQPDIVYVALGFPKAEKLIHHLRAEHILPRAWYLGVGISFSYVCGQIKRAPLWMQRIGLESFYRLAQEPRRLARRYLIDGPAFALRLLTVSLLQGYLLTALRQRPIPVRLPRPPHDPTTPGHRWESKTNTPSANKTTHTPPRSSTGTAASAH